MPGLSPISHSVTHGHGNKYTKFSINPLSFNVVKLHYIEPEFQAMIDTISYLANSYRDVRIVGGTYDFVFNNQMIQKSRDYWNIRLGLILPVTCSTAVQAW